MKKIIQSIVTLATIISSSICWGNPVAVPYYVIEAENVLIGITDKGAVVTGTYHFKWNEQFQGKWTEDFTRFWLQLPVPMATDVKGSDAVEAEAAPVLIIDGKSYSPQPKTFVWKLDNLPNGMKVVVFDFWIKDQKFGEKIVAKIQYHQPILKTDGKDMVYYIPFLAFMDQDRKPLNKESLLINFQSFADVTLMLRTPHEEIIQQTPKLISIRPRHKEIIGVERIPAPLEIKL